MSVGETLVSPSPRRPAAAARLLVTEKDEQGLYRPVGFLDAQSQGDGVSYRFAYLASAVRRPSFQPLLGFRDTTQAYESVGLFPLFAERIMDPRRPDRPLFLAALDLSEDQATPLEVLARSGGQRPGDGIFLIPVPRIEDDGSTVCTFLVHGIRYVDGAAERIDALRAGDRLCLMSQPDNLVNEHAVLVTETEGQPLGWVPDALLEYVNRVEGRQLTVVRVNPPDVGTRLRLLVRLEGSAESDRQPFAGPDWMTVG